MSRLHALLQLLLDIHVRVFIVFHKCNLSLVNMAIVTDDIRLLMLLSVCRVTIEHFEYMSHMLATEAEER